MTIFVLAQLSDLHLALPPRPRQLASKRGLGFINWHRGRKRIHRPEVLDAVTRDLKAAAVDHTVVTGDLTNLSLPGEYDRARAWLETLGPPRDVTVIPGNHDIYVRGVEQAPAKFWGEYMRGDDRANAIAFPFVRRRGPVALIALSTALPTAPLLATGRLGEAQCAGLAQALEQTRDLFRIVLIHHPPRSPARRHLRRLTDAAQFRDVLAARGCELVLHGHDHCCALIWLDGPHSKIPVVGAPSASAHSRHRHEDAAGYNLFHITGETGAWHCELIGRQRDAGGNMHDAERRVLA